MGIHLDQDWCGPNLTMTTNNQGMSEKKIKYYSNVYIPIPRSLFADTDTRAFDIDVRAWVSVANKTPKQLSV